MDTSHYVYLSNDGYDVSNIDSGRPKDFITWFNMPLSLEGEWEVALVDVTLGPAYSLAMYLCSDICTVSRTHDKTLPVLRYIGGSINNAGSRHLVIERPHYHTITTRWLEHLDLFATDRLLNRISLTYSIACTLHFRKKKYHF